MSRVLVVTNDFPTRRGGIESFVLALCERMPTEEVVVYTASMPGDAAYDANLGFPVYRDPASTLLPTRSLGSRVAGVMRRHGCDRVLFGASAPLGLLAPAVRRAGARRVVAMTHGHEVWWSRVPAARTALRRIGDEVDVLTYVSQWCREKIAAALSPQAAGRMVQLSPGVDTERFRPGCGGDEVRRQLGIDEHAAVVVCTARMVRRKGQDTLIRGWRQVLDAHPDARLLLVGDGPDRARLEALAQAEGVSGSTIFVGSVPWREVPSYTDAGDLLAMPCRSRLWGLEPEAFGIVFLEAQACGIPVVVGRSGGAPETLLSPGNGEVVDPRDVDAVASGIARWLTRSGTDEVQPGQISASASGHSWDRSAATLAGLWG